MLKKSIPPVSSGFGIAATFLAIVFLFVTVVAAQAQTSTILHSFNGTEGENPSGDLLIDTQGVLYGTTSYGGASNLGTIFRLYPSTLYQVRHHFSGADGSYPVAGLIMDTPGNLYGTTSGGGASGYGTVFKVDPAGAYGLLHHFTNSVVDNSTLTPAGPIGPLTPDPAGNLYGTTFGGGCWGSGAVFKLDNSGTETFYSVDDCSPNENIIDGRFPYGGVVRDAAGNLYGTTEAGYRDWLYGTLFKVEPSGTVTPLHTFGGGNPNGVLLDPNDGQNPYGRLFMDSGGNLYGTTYRGGTYGYGTIFKMDPAGGYSVLHHFTGGATDGGNPLAGVVKDSAGSLYGTTSLGGAFNKGIVFRLYPNGTYSVLHHFAGGVADGASPTAGVVVDSAGSLYGTTSLGGAFDKGTVFKITGLLQASIGTVTDLIGEAINATTGKGLKKGDSLNQNDRIEVLQSSSVKITFIDGTTITIGENASLTLDEYVYDTGTNKGNLSFSWLRGPFVWISGLMESISPAKKEIRTVFSTGCCGVGIRGTQFIARYITDPVSGVTATGMRIDLLEGVLDITKQDTQTTTSFIGPVTIVTDASHATPEGLTQDGYKAIKAQLFLYPELINLVKLYVTKPDVEADMVKTLKKAQTATAEGKLKLANNQLASFISQVSAQSGKSLTVDQADILIGRATALQK